jgi:hypothetical protein
MRGPRRILVLVVLAVLGLAVVYALLKPRLDRDPRSNLGYVAWKAGAHGYSPAYAGLILRDTAFTQRLLGERLEDVVSRYGILLHDGAMFPASSYRGRYQELLREREPEVQCYWFDDEAENRGYCLWVENRRIKRLMIVKG